MRRRESERQKTKRQESERWKSERQKTGKQESERRESGRQGTKKREFCVVFLVFLRVARILGFREGGFIKS